MWSAGRGLPSLQRALLLAVMSLGTEDDVVVLGLYSTSLFYIICENRRKGEAKGGRSGRKKGQREKEGRNKREGNDCHVFAVSPYLINFLANNQGENSCPYPNSFSTLKTTSGGEAGEDYII